MGIANLSRTVFRPDHKNVFAAVIIYFDCDIMIFRTCDKIGARLLKKGVLGVLRSRTVSYFFTPELRDIREQGIVPPAVCAFASLVILWRIKNES